jgi:small multidrug resistance pump
MQSWLFLAAAILLEVAGTTSMKLADGFTKPWPSALLFVFYACSFVALTGALKHLELSVAYTVWAGLGTALVALIGVVHFQETFTLLKAVSMILIVAGVIGLSLARSTP